jgi:hypothetical protein
VPNCALEVLIHTWWYGFVVLISNVFEYHLRIQEAVTANAAMPLVGGEDVRTPLRAFRVVFGIRQLIISRGPVLTNPTIYADRPLPGAARVRRRSRSGMGLHFVHGDPQVPVHDPLLEDARQEVGDQSIGVRPRETSARSPASARSRPMVSAVLFGQEFALLRAALGKNG